MKPQSQHSLNDKTGAVQLRALQERVIQPVGASQTIPVNVRVISATHQNLEEAMVAGTFRQDLYFRLKGIEVQIPPLRNRREDILLLANYFLERTQHQRQANNREFTADAIDALLHHHWPGNVRELEHAILSATTLCEGEFITRQDLGLAHPDNASDETPFVRYFGLPLTEAKNRLVEDFERAAIAAALNESSGNVSAAARHLGMHRQSLQQKMNQLRINR